MNMASNFSFQNNLQGLRMQITSTHIMYLCEEKSPVKIEYRDTLQNYIKEFLSIVPHRNKFSFSRTADIFRRSVYSEGFNALKAASAWLALSTYANNLFTQPWRKEYYEIKLYSGFYKHHIENCLCDAKAIFELMGYKCISGNQMVFEGSVDQDRLSSTSLDALIAMCECQILFGIYQEITKHFPSYSWVDILKFREVYTGTVEQTIHDILTMIIYHTSECGNDVKTNYSHYHLGCQKYHEIPLKLHPSYVPVNGCCNYYQSSVCYPPHSSVEHLSFINGHYCRVPTAKLIDLDDSFDSTCSSYYKKLNSGRWHSDENRCRVEQYPLTESNNSCDEEPIRRRERDVRKNTERINSRKSWEYVYQGLENKEKKEKNYRLSVNQNKGKTKSNGVSEAFNNLKLGSDSDISGSYLEDDVDSRKLKNLRKNNTPVSNSESVKKGRLTESDQMKDRGRVSPRFIQKDTKKICISSDLKSSTWSCSACTYNNVATRDICEICNKSKNLSNDIPLISGGKHCNKCTLVNKKEATKCEVCETNLEGSPTYV